MSHFKDTYVVRDGDITVRELRPDRYEVHVWVGSIETGAWQIKPVMTLTELNKTVRSYSLLGEHDGWKYYRT